MDLKQFGELMAKLKELDDVAIAVVGENLVDDSKHITGLVMLEGTKLFKRSLIEYALRCGLTSQDLDTLMPPGLSFVTNDHNVRCAKKIALAIVTERSVVREASEADGVH